MCYCTNLDTIVQGGGGGGHREEVVGGDLGVVPALLSIPVDLKHMIGERLSKLEVLKGLFVL